MARPKPDYDSMIILQEFLTREQAMAYTHRGDAKFKADILPYVNIYDGGQGECFYLPELRRRMLNLRRIKSKL